jgi:protein TonB
MSGLILKSNNADRASGEPAFRLGRLPSPSHESSLRSLFSNLRDFLVERPVKLRAGSPMSFGSTRFGDDFGGNLKEFFRSGPRGPVTSGLLVDWREETGFWQNLRDLIAPRKLPPLKTTSRPIPVPEIWSKNTQFTRVQALSVAFHVVVVVLLVLPLWSTLITPPTTQAKTTFGDTPLVSPYLPPAPKKAGGGGGAHDNAPVAKGKLPKFAWTQFSKPMVKPPEHPEIAMTPTVLGNPQVNLPNLNATNWGDPNGKANNDSLGQGHGTGVGNGNGAGVGPGEGWNTGGGAPNAGTGGYGFAACLYCPRADYSDEAMKVKVMGVVELMATITPDGRVTDIHVAKGLGFGLDEKAVQAVRSWRLKPALGPDGRPAAVRQLIELTFQLF